MDTRVKEVVAVLDGKIVPTEEELKLFKRAFWSTYQTIGSDAQLEGAPKTTVAEVVLDANYAKHYGHLTEEQYNRFDNWVRQEITPDYKKGLRKLVKIFWSRDC